MTLECVSIFAFVYTGAFTITSFAGVARTVELVIRPTFVMIRLMTQYTTPVIFVVYVNSRVSPFDVSMSPGNRTVVVALELISGRNVMP